MCKWCGRYGNRTKARRKDQVTKSESCVVALMDIISQTSKVRLKHTCIQITASRRAECHLPSVFNYIVPTLKLNNSFFFPSLNQKHPAVSASGLEFKIENKNKNQYTCENILPSHSRYKQVFIVFLSFQLGQIIYLLTSCILYIGCIFPYISWRTIDNTGTALT